MVNNTAVTALKNIMRISIFCVAIWFVATFIAVISFVDGRSMNPTLEDKEAMVVNKVAYNKTIPSRFDIIVFKVPKEISKRGYFVKRVIGLPGEKVRIDNKGTIYINGSPLEEDYGTERIENAGLAENEIEVMSDEVFVLGDNRNHSEDSRHEVIGNVKFDRILGKVSIRVWPVSKYGYIDLYRTRKEQERKK